jgi:hypothetical protein
MQAFKQKVSKKVSLPSSATICSCTPQKYYIFRKLPNNFATFFQQNAKKREGENSSSLITPQVMRGDFYCPKLKYYHYNSLLRSPSNCFHTSLFKS